MSSAPIRKPTVSIQLPEEDGGKPAQPGQLFAKKMPRSLKPSDEVLDQTSNTLDDVCFLRLPEVKAVTGLSKTSIYELIREKNFPAPVRLGTRAVAWLRSEIRQWALERVRASRSAA